MNQKLIIEQTVKTATVNDAGQETNVVTVGTGRATATADAKIEMTPAVAAGVDGAISAAGVDGMPTDHGIEAADLIGVSWGTSCRYNLTVDVANANDIQFDETPAGGGDALPAEDTAVVVAKEVDVTLTLDGDNVAGILLLADQNCHARFEEDDGTVIMELDLVADEPYSWLYGGAVTNPLTGDPWAKIVAINKSTTAATLKVFVVYDV